MIDINATVPLLDPVSSTVQQVVNLASILVGGIFGIYLISLAVRLIFFKKTLDLYKEIRASMKRIEDKIDKLGKKKR
ncbi:hypothetical protein KY347_01910 [Candidatus Woesearchaeota archaeon]|nr:hypothetical protein [Candidatus Woesearchaeota archaeon]